MIPFQEFYSFYRRYFRIVVTQTFMDPRSLPSLITRFLTLLRIMSRGERRRRASVDKLSTPVPRIAIFSVTWQCNLSCTGCYALNFGVKEGLSVESIMKVINEGTELGVFIWTIAGGEPILVETLLERLVEVKDAYFLFYTNATCIDDSHIALFRKGRNILPVVSIEGEGSATDNRRGAGVGEKVRATMGRLRRARVPFAFSTMVTHENCRAVTSRQWLDSLWREGARFGFLVDYIPCRKNLVQSFVLTDEDRAYKEAELARRNAEARPVVFNLPPDEYESGECLAAGKGLIHINADGYIEPCPFSHFAADNVRESSLRESLDSPFLREIRTLTTKLDNPNKECTLFRHGSTVAEVAEKTGAVWTEQ